MYMIFIPHLHNHLKENILMCYIRGEDTYSSLQSFTLGVFTNKTEIKSYKIIP